MITLQDSKIDRNVSNGASSREVDGCNVLRCKSLTFLILRRRCATIGVVTDYECIVFRI
jgi:hypothetical protein